MSDNKLLASLLFVIYPRNTIFILLKMFPHIRLRRNRRFPWLRDLIAEVGISSNDLIYPLFVVEGYGIKEEIKTLPGVFRYSIDQLIEVVKLATDVNIKAIAIFPVVNTDLKNNQATEAYNHNNIICQAIRAVKKLNLPIGIIADVALDPYTIHGHDGFWQDNDVANDITNEILCKQAIVLAEAGVDIIAPSDMMDGRIGVIRQALDAKTHQQIAILSYAVKYASSLYGPFRDAVGTRSLLKTDKKTYQMDYRNIKESISEIFLDIEEGADMVMVKPGMLYLDIIRTVSQEFNVPIFAYQVSGEYAMLKYAALNGCFDWHEALIESLICFKRAGSSAILTYAALEAAKILNK